jgi:hypothetical protein
MKTIPLFGTGILGKSATVTAQRRVNCYFEIRQDGDKANIAIYGTPGTAQVFSTGLASTICGVHVMNNSVTGGTPIVFMTTTSGYLLQAVYLNPTWMVTTVAALPSSPGYTVISMCDNGKQLFITGLSAGSGASAACIYTLSTTTIVSVNVGNQIGSEQVGSATGTYLDGYFFADGNSGGGSPGTFFMSNFGDGTTWSALNFGTMQSSPGYLVAIDSDHGYLILFGEKSIEFWQNTGSAGFPYAPIKSSTAQIGLAAKDSRVKFDNTTAFLGTDTSGQVRIYELQSYLPVAISTPDIDNIINSMPLYSDAVALAYRLDGHEFLQMTFPTGNRSFLYDNSTQIWSEVQTGVGTYQAHAARLSVKFPVNGLGGISYGPPMTLVTNATDGNVCQLVPGGVTDAITGSGNGQILRLVQTRHLVDQGNVWAIDEVFLDMETGTAANGVSPQVVMQVSKDGGHTFGEERYASAGMTGQYKGPRVTYRRLGSARDFVLRFKMTDPAKWVITYGAALMRGLGK